MSECLCCRQQLHNCTCAPASTIAEMMSPEEIQAAMPGADELFKSKPFPNEEVEELGLMVIPDPDSLPNYENLVSALKLAREKIVLYRQAHSGEYIGGAEYNFLIRTIDDALSIDVAKDKERPVDEEATVDYREGWELMYAYLNAPSVDPGYESVKKAVLAELNKWLQESGYEPV